MQQDRTQGAPQMCRYPPSTIHRYLYLPSTQRIQTHTSHIHSTTPPLPTLVQAPYPLPTYTTHTTATKTQTHVQHSSCPHRIGEARHPHSLTLSQHTHKQQNMHHSHRNNRTHNIGYYDNLTNRPITTTGLLTPHKHTDPTVKAREISSYCKST